MYKTEDFAQQIEIPIMHCFDNNYVIPAAVSFHSMLKHANPQYKYRLFVLHTDITLQNQMRLLKLVEKYPNASLSFLNMENKFIEEVWGNLDAKCHYSKEVLYKLLVASIFPDYEKIIITDVDVVFVSDISQSYFALNPVENVCFAGVHHIAPRGTFLEEYYKCYGSDELNKLKICSGYLVANLNYMRTAKKEEQFVDCLINNIDKFHQVEQDVINFCCTEKEIKYLPLSNVVCTYMYDIFSNEKYLENDPFYLSQEIVEALKCPVQLHYATGKKPWKNICVTKADIWFKYLMETEFYYIFKKEHPFKNFFQITYYRFLQRKK